MNGPRDYHTKRTRSEREIQIPYDNHLYVEFKIWHKWAYLQNRNRPTDRKQIDGYHRGKGGKEGYIRSLGLADTNYYT